MGKSWFSDENGAKKKNIFQKCQKKVLGRGVKSGQVGVQQTNIFFILGPVYYLLKPEAHGHTRSPE